MRFQAAWSIAILLKTDCGPAMTWLRFAGWDAGEDVSFGSDAQKTGNGGRYTGGGVRAVAEQDALIADESQRET